MKKLIVVLCLCILMAFPNGAYAYSKAEIVIDTSCERVLHKLNIDEPLPMASTTKIMTAITAIEHGELDSMVTASAYAASTTGSRMELREGDELTLHDLIIAMLFVSGNDGATAIAEHISGNEEAFAELMTQKAKEIGCVNTSFANAHGLDAEDHYTTAHDLAKIASYAIKNEVFYDIVSSLKREITINGNKVTFYNKNKMKTSYEYGIGGKTGYTEDAGRCLVSYAEKDGFMLVCVVMNSTDMYNDSIALLKNTYNKYSLAKIVSKGDIIASLPIERGMNDSYIVKFPKDIYVPLTEDEEQNALMQYLLPDTLNAPINSGEEIGRYALTLGDERILLGILNCEYDLKKKDNILELMRKIILLSAYTVN